MSGSSSKAPRSHTSASNMGHKPVSYITLSAASRLLPSAGEWNSIELDFSLFPQSKTGYDSIPSQYSKSYDHELVITNKKYFKRFVCISVIICFVIVAIVLLVHFLPHNQKHQGSSKNLTLALNQALTFFDAQKSGTYPINSAVKFRGTSGMQDGNETNVLGGLVGGFYDSGINIKFTFPTAYTITLLSWTVIEYHDKYADIGELGHVKDIIRWGSDYLLKVIVAPNSSVPFTLYSQVGSASNNTQENNDRCWQRPEDMSHQRPAMKCDGRASDLAGEVMAALSAASLVFAEDFGYSLRLTQAAEKIFEIVTSRRNQQGTYTQYAACGGEARMYYNSSSYKDELVWGGTWLFFATGNITYLDYVSRTLNASVVEEPMADRGVLYWNNKLTAVVVLLTRIRYFRDFGYPYEDALISAQRMTDAFICSYISNGSYNMTKGGLIVLKAEYGQHLQYATTSSFLAKLYSDYLQLLRSRSISCLTGGFSLKYLQFFSLSQINYILGDNPMKMSYVVGFGNQYPNHVHHRAASIPWDGKHYTCADGDNWLHSSNPNPNILLGAMVAGPDQFDNFVDERDKPWFTEPNIANNAGLVAALISLHDSPHYSPDTDDNNIGIDQFGIFQKIHLVPQSP